MQVVCGIFDQTALRLCSAPVSECSAGSRVLSALRCLGMQLVTAQKQWVIQNAIENRMRCCANTGVAPLAAKLDAMLVCYIALANPGLGVALFMAARRVAIA